MSEASSSPAMARLFGGDDFAWSFLMQKSDARSFFEASDVSGQLLAEKQRLLEQHPDRHLVIHQRSKPLIAALAHTLEEWNLPCFTPTDDLASIARQVEPDLLLMEQGTQQLVAAAVCFPSSWTPTHWAGKAMHEIHQVVPMLNPSIGPMIGRFLTQLQPGKSYQRANWSLTVGSEPNHHPALSRPPLDELSTLDDIYLRLEHQLFTAIPGGVLMGIRIQPVALTTIADDTQLWAHLIRKLTTMPEPVARYKNLHRGLPSLIAQMKARSASR